MTREFHVRFCEHLGGRFPGVTRPVVENFFKTLKVERVYRQTYATRDHARIDIVNWIEGFYNRYRLHSSNGFQSPVDAQASLMAT